MTTCEQADPVACADPDDDDVLLEAGLPMPRRLLAVFSISAGTLLLMLDASIANVGLPVIGHDLHAKGADAVLIVTVYNLVLAMTLMPFATIGMHIGLRRLFVGGLMTFVAGAGLSWFADSLPVLLAVRGIQSLGAAAAISVSSALVRTTYPRRQLGRGLGLNTLAASVGAAMAPVVGGALVSRFSWHLVFVIGAPLALAAIFAGRALPEPENAGRRFDTVGAGLCAATFGLLIFGLHGVTGGEGVVVPALLLAAGAGAAVLLVRFELRHPHPVLPVDLLKTRELALAVAAALCGYLASAIIILSLPFFLHQAGYVPAAVGEVIVPYALVSTVIAPSSGILSDRIAPARLGVVGLAIAVVALLALSRLHGAPGHWEVEWPLGLCGIGFGLFMSPNARLMIGSVSAERAAAASSLNSTTRMMSQAVASTIVGALLTIGVWPASALLGAALAALAGCFTFAQLWKR